LNSPPFHRPSFRPGNGFKFHIILRNIERLLLLLLLDFLGGVIDDDDENNGDPRLGCGCNDVDVGLRNKGDLSAADAVVVVAVVVADAGLCK
jgi:hypothetical protein